MEPPNFWIENKKTILTTAIVVIVALLIIKFFDYIFLTGIIVALAVAAVIGWGYLSKKHSGVAGVWKAFLKELGFEAE